MRIKPQIILREQSGAALVIALLMMIVITLIGVASTSTSIFEIKLAGNKRGSTSAFYAAESGIQIATANIQNFNLDARYVDNKYDPFTDSNNPNPTNAKVTINYDPTQEGAPRGLGFSATGNFEFKY
jgi:type IV pilus assembly protein PilX